MTVPPSVSATADAACPIHRFSHQAMACTWEVLVAGEEAGYAEQAVWAAWDELDRLEQELSRFVPCSDVSRINASGRDGSRVRVGIATWECLQLVHEIHEQTGGAFDITVGALLDSRRAEDGRIQAPDEREPATDEPPIGMELLDVDEQERTVGLCSDNVAIDLGAVGKGYAVDQMAGVLRDWSLPAALIHSGQSSVYALGAPAGQTAWSVLLRDPERSEAPLGVARLRDRALSGSGMRLHGQHILDPHTGRPAEGKRATWALAPTAARSDALSTAFMVMPAEKVEEYCRRHAGVAALLLIGGPSEEPVLQCFGDLEGVEVG